MIQLRAALNCPRSCAHTPSWNVGLEARRAKVKISAWIVSRCLPGGNVPGGGHSGMLWARIVRGGDIIRRLPARESSSSDFRSGAALHHVAMGEALARKGDLVGALRSYGESLKIFGSLASQPADRKAFL